MSDFDGMDFANMESEMEASQPYIPKGDYNCIIYTCEKYTSNAGNESIKLECKVHNEPKYNGWVLRKYFSLWHPKEEVRGYAQSDFKRLLTALGMTNAPDDATDLQGKTLLVTVSEKDNSDNPNEDYRETSNEIVAFRTPKDDGFTPPTQADVPPSMAAAETGKPSI
jgi:hypothetical protein|tara:strand:+ start:601 stop:1101 length:501 start_codon:yes stop_codon:yes gene_type:complete